MLLNINVFLVAENRNEVEVPDVKPRRPKAYKTHEGELTTLPGNTTVSVSPDGTVTVTREKEEELEEDEEIKEEVKDEIESDEDDDNSEEIDEDSDDD